MFVYNFIDVDLCKANGFLITVFCEMLLEREARECAWKYFASSRKCGPDNG